MNYVFPTIKTIDDVLPHIEGREEFFLAQKDHYDVINYQVAYDKTFDMTEDYLGSIIRRECRGIIFDKCGKIISRPFHKFFNLGEKEETRIENLNMNQKKHIYHKLDGSMIRPIEVQGEVRLATKMGITDTSIQAEEWLKSQNPMIYDWMCDMYHKGYTPLYEWISPDNLIVLGYKESDLVLLAVRENFSGRYLRRYEYEYDGSQVKVYDDECDNLSEFVNNIRGKKDEEGVIIRFDNGHMLKLKNEWYVRIHKIKEKFQNDRHIIRSILLNEMDDVISLLDDENRNRIINLENDFHMALISKKNQLYDLYNNVKHLTKKEFAQRVMPTLENKRDSTYIFYAMDGKSIEDRLMADIDIMLNNNTKFDELRKYMNF